MPRNKEHELIEGREPDDLKEGQRQQSVGRRTNEHEDIEESRMPQRRDASSDEDEEEITDDDIVEVDLDRGPEDQGPDA